jgi:hypothetical protein
LGLGLAELGRGGGGVGADQSAQQASSVHALVLHLPVPSKILSNTFDLAIVLKRSSIAFKLFPEKCTQSYPWLGNPTQSFLLASREEIAPIGKIWEYWWGG